MRMIAGQALLWLSSQTGDQVFLDSNLVQFTPQIACLLSTPPQS